MLWQTTRQMAEWLLRDALSTLGSILSEREEVSRLKRGMNILWQEIEDERKERCDRLFLETGFRVPISYLAQSGAHALRSMKATLFIIRIRCRTRASGDSSRKNACYLSEAQHLRSNKYTNRQQVYLLVEPLDVDERPGTGQ